MNLLRAGVCLAALWAATLSQWASAAIVVQDAIVTQTNGDYVYWEAEWFDRITNNNADPATLPVVVGSFPSAASGGEVLRIFAQANNNNPNNNQIAYRFHFNSPSPANYTFYAFRATGDADSMFVPQDFDVDAAVGGGGQANTTSGRWNSLVVGWNTLGITSVGDSPLPGYFATGQRNYEVTAADVLDGDVAFRLGTREAARYDRFVLHKTPNLTDAQLNALTLSQLTIVNDIVPPPPPSSPALVNIGPPGTTGAWGIREVRHNGTVSGVQGAINSLTSNDANPLSGVRKEAFYPVINFNDPQSPGGGGNFGNGSKVPFLSNDVLPDGTVGGATDDNGIALIAHAKVRIDAEDDYTFGFRGDDGSRLKIVGANFTNVVGGGAGDSYVSPFDTIQFLGDTGDSNTMGVTHLTPGNYDMEFIFNENGGGAFIEVFAARGAKTAFDNSFNLIGAPAVPNRNTFQKPSVTDEGGLWNVIRLNGPNSIDDAIVAVQNAWLANSPGDAQDHPQSINYTDPQAGGGNKAGFAQVSFPGDGPGDDNSFAIGARGTLTVVEAGNYTFTSLGDDGSQLEIFGTHDWTAAGIAAPIFDGFKIASCCSDGSGTVFLEPGEYEIEYIWNEIGGGAYAGLWASKDGSDIFLLGDTSAFTIGNGRPAGLQLVPEPSSLVLVGLGLLGLLGLARRRKQS